MAKKKEPEAKPEPAYKVLAAKGPSAPSDLEAQVKNLLADGWSLAGGLASDGARLCQALTKE